MNRLKRIVVLSSPSGGGKSTIAKRILSEFPKARFSVSATTRSPRPGEIDGVHYRFLKREEFEAKIAGDELTEFEEFFGSYYGTLKSDVQDVLQSGAMLLLDVDVKGALSIRNAFPEDSLLIFIAPPDKETLEKRLRARGSESEEKILDRLARADFEMATGKSFDFWIINDDLERAVRETLDILYSHSADGDERKAQTR